MLRATLSALPIHYMSIFHLSKWVIKRIDSIRRKFLWFGASKSGGFFPVAWRKIIKDISEGGLGIIDLAKFNIVLICKHWWHILTGKEIIWRDLVLDNYYKRRLICSGWHNRIPRCSVFWRNILKVENIFRALIQWCSIDGHSTLLWIQD